MELLNIALQTEVITSVDEASKGWDLLKGILGFSIGEITVVGVLIWIIIQQHFTIRNRNASLKELDADLRNCFETRNAETKENLVQVHLALVENKTLSNYVMEALEKVNTVVAGYGNKN